MHKNVLCWRLTGTNGSLKHDDAVDVNVSDRTTLRGFLAHVLKKYLIFIFLKYEINLITEVFFFISLLI